MTKPDFDPSKVEWQKLFSKIDKDKTKDFTGSVEDFIKGEFKMPTATSVAEGALKPQAPVSGLYAGAREKGYKTTFEGAAKASGVPMESLMGASGGITPKTTISGSTSKFEFGAFRPESLADIKERLATERIRITSADPKDIPDQEQRLARVDHQIDRLVETMKAIDPNSRSFEAMKNNALVGLTHAQEKLKDFPNDPDAKAAVEKARQKVLNISENEYISVSAGKEESHEKAMSRLEAKLVEIGKPQTPQQIQAKDTVMQEIKIRGEARKALKDAEGSDEQKDRFTNLTTYINMTRNRVLQSIIPADNLYTANDGSVAIKSLNRPELAYEASIVLQQELIKMLTKDGVPITNAHKMGLMSQGVDFDADGKAVVNRQLTPAYRPLPTGGQAGSIPTETPPAATTPSRTLSMPPVAAPTAPPAAVPATSAPPKINIADERQKAAAAIAKGAPEDKVKAVFKQKTGQDY
jgi:hypothetical protein